MHRRFVNSVSVATLLLLGIARAGTGFDFPLVVGCHMFGFDGNDNVTQSMIRKAYRKVTLSTHPDTQRGRGASGQWWSQQDVNEARDAMIEHAAANADRVRCAPWCDGFERIWQAKREDKQRAESERNQRRKEQQWRAKLEEQQRRAEREEQQRRAEREEQQRRAEREGRRRRAEREEQQRRAEREEQQRRAEREEQQRRAERGKKLRADGAVVLVLSCVLLVIAYQHRRSQAEILRRPAPQPKLPKIWGDGEYRLRVSCWLTERPTGVVERPVPTLNVAAPSGISACPHCGKDDFVSHGGRGSHVTHCRVQTERFYANADAWREAQWPCGAPRTD